MDKNIVWAIDPYEKGIRPDSSLLAQLTEWSKKSGLPIQPVYLLSSSPEEGGRTGYSPDTSAAAKLADNYIKDLRIAGTKPSAVIRLEAASRSDEIAALLSFAIEKSAPCILISSHGRSGLGRFLFGSFAESLLMQSSIPIFFLTQEDYCQKTTAFQRVLFATDFSEHSLYVYKKFLEQAKQSNWEIILFHTVSLPASALMSSLETQVMVSADYFSEQLAWAKEEGLRWSKFAEGVNVRVVVNDEGIAGDLSESILRQAKKEEVNFIAMSSASSAVSALTLGSISQDIFRSKLFPVWVYGPKVIS